MAVLNYGNGQCDIDGKELKKEKPVKKASKKKASK